MIIGALASYGFDPSHELETACADASSKHRA